VDGGLCPGGAVALNYVDANAKAGGEKYFLKKVLNSINQRK
jgi:hypothetical protein